MKKQSIVAIRKKLKKKLEKECMDLWQQVVKKRAGYKCEVRGTIGDMQAHHIWHKRTFPILRYNPDNGVCLSKEEHCRIHMQGEGELMGLMIKKRGEAWFDRLQELRHNQGFQYTIENLEDIKLELTTLLGDK